VATMLASIIFWDNERASDFIKHSGDKGLAISRSPHYTPSSQCVELSQLKSLTIPLSRLPLMGIANPVAREELANRIQCSCK